MTKLKLTAEPGSHALTMTREFNAPRHLVFKAYTDPTLISQWWGSKETTAIIDQMDVKHGGVWRYIQHDTSGNEYIWRGVYHDVVAPERLVYTFEFEAMPGHILLETMTFEEQDGKTLVTDLAVFQSVADRDWMIEVGMEQGAEESWDSLEALLKTL